jgi:hypothetical protein
MLTRRVLGVAVIVLTMAGALAVAVRNTPTADASSRSTAAHRSATSHRAGAAPELASSSVSPAASAEEVVASPIAPDARAAVAGPFVLADAGNSILYDAEPAIAAMLGDGRFFPHTIGGFGISVRPDVWRPVFGSDVVADDPAVVVVLLGNRDFPAALSDPDGYRAELDESVRLLASRGARILWLGLPPLPPSPTDELGRQAVNRLFAELPERFPGVVRFVPTDGVLGGPGGSFVRMVPSADGGETPIRKIKPDGSGEEHLCPDGAARLAALIRSELSTLVAVPAAPAGWERAGWRSQPRYDDPPGACRT